MTSPRRSYPGARWWKFDFHTHTPKSKDWRGDEGTTPETWLLACMAAELDAVVITDHNSGEWVDPLKAAYARMKAAAEGGTPAQGFRELMLFPGVEISAQGGVHILAVLDPSASTSEVDKLLGSVEYDGTQGDSDGVTSKGLAEVLGKILDAEAIPIPAHADRSKGLLECQPGSGRSKVDANTLRQALDVDGLLAVEWCNPANEAPECAKAQFERLARVLGSDCHRVQQGGESPGARFTWVKMARPNLDGLRLALLDGNDVSIRRSDEGAFDPNQVPSHTLTTIGIANARYMGNGSSARIELSPFFNAIVGGRGTGKSTVVHALRLAAGRGLELVEGSDARKQFDAFRKIVKGRAGDGALKDKTDLKLEWRHDDARLRLVWRADGATTAVEEWRDGDWRPTASQAVNAERFPLRILSQGQIAHIAGEGRRALLDIIDQAAGVDSPRKELDEATRAFKAQRAKLRELAGRLAELPEVERKLGEAVHKLEAFAQSDHATVLRDYARASHQHREVKTTFDQAREVARRIAELPDELVLDDWNQQHFTDEDGDLRAWRADVDATMEQVRSELRAMAAGLREKVDGWNHDGRIEQWRAWQEGAKRAHATLQEQLKDQGVQDPGAFERLTRERQALEQKRRDLARLQADHDVLLGENDQQGTLIAERRARMTEARKEFVKGVLRDNPHVKISVMPYGFDARQVERELRELLDTGEDKFAADILTIRSEEASGEEVASGLAHELAAASDKVEALARLRSRLIDVETFGGHFKNHLTKKHAQPELADRILTWFPEDDLRIEYQRGGSWTSIEQGSQGQRSAALLAFLLAFGEEPLVLDQPEDDLDNHLIYNLIVTQIRKNKLRRQLVIVTHNPNVVVNGDAELVHVMEFGRGQCFVKQSGALQEAALRKEVCEVMEGGHEAFARRWKRLGTEV